MSLGDLPRPLRTTQARGPALADDRSAGILPAVKCERDARAPFQLTPLVAQFLDGRGAEAAAAADALEDRFHLLQRAAPLGGHDQLGDFLARIEDQDALARLDRLDKPAELSFRR